MTMKANLHTLLLILALLVPVTASAYVFEVDGIYYKISSISPATVEVTYKDAHYNSYSGSVVIPSNVIYQNVNYSVTSIGYRAFCNCSSLTDISISNSVTSIGEFTFSGCSALTSVNMPNTLSSIGEGAFFGCTGLTSITIPNSVTSISKAAFNNCSGLMSVTIPNSVTDIGISAFSHCSSLTRIVIPNSVTTIAEYAFNYCSGLASLSIPNSVKIIGIEAFNETPWYNNQPDGLVYAGMVAYKYKGTMPSGTSITINEGTISIAESAFSGCYGLKSIVFPNSITTIGNGAFQNCRSLTSVTIPNSVTYISNRMFGGCDHLININLPNSITTIGSYAFSNSGLISINIPNSVAYIGEGAFSNCGGLTSIDLGNSVAFIGNCAFQFCASLTNITIPSSISSINYSAFAGCSSLTEVIIPYSVNSISQWAFANCGSLHDVYNYATTVPNTNSYTFDYSTPIGSATLYVPVGCREAYAATYPWSDFGQIVEIEGGGEEDLFLDCPAGEVRDAALYLYNLGIVEGENGMLLPSREAKRAELAKMSLYGAYNGRANVPAVLPSDNYPTIYADLQNPGAYYYRPARALLYLEYGDGVAPFDRDRLAFEPDSTISRVNALKVLLESFNIQPDVTGTTNPFPSDAAVTALATGNPVKMGYIRRAAALGIITTANATFRPHDRCTRGEYILMLARLMQKTSWQRPQDTDYFEPLNTTLRTISLGLDLPMGNFSHYTRTSFDLDGTVPLTFAHAYNSYNTTLPEVFFGARTVEGVEDTYQPLGDGWSHSYHSFITVVGDLTGGSARMIVHWGGGGIDVYRSEGSRFVAESLGVYDDCVLEGTDVVITTKDQVRYRFKPLGGALHYLASATDRNGNTLTLNYEAGVNGRQRVKSVSDGHRSLTFSYLSGTNLVSQVSDPLGRSVRFGYAMNSRTGRRQLSTFTDAKGQTTRYEYGDASKSGSSKLLTRIQLPKGNSIENEYDANRRLSRTVSVAGGVPTAQTSVSVTASYGGGGSVSTQSTVDVLRAGGQPSSYHYTYNGDNAVTAMTGAEGLFVNSAYGDAAHPQLPTAVQSNSTNVSSVTYDARGNVTSVTVTGDGTLKTTMTYDAMNNLTSVTDPKGYTTTYTYDGNGNLVGVEAPENATTAITRDDRGLPLTVTDPMGVKTAFEYNVYGNLTKTTLPAINASSSATYDKAGRLTGTTDALGRTATFSYDANDNLVSLTDAAGHATGYAYDANGNITEVTNAKGGVTSLSYDSATDWLTSVSFAGATKSYAYNDDGTLSAYTKPDGTTLRYIYDGLGRVTSDGVNRYSYDSKMRLSSITDGGSTLSFTYDGFNRVTGTSCAGHSNTYSYDRNGNRTAVNGTAYTYDRLNRLTSVRFGGRTITYTYRKDSRLSSVSYPNGMTTTYGYDTGGRLVSKRTRLAGGTIVAAYTFTLDKQGNITGQSVQEPYGAAALSAEDVSYSYDSGNRVTKAGTTTFSYDANGNTVKRGFTRYTWDNLDILMKDYVSWGIFDFDLDRLPDYILKA